MWTLYGAGKIRFFFSFNKVVVNLQFKADANIVQRIVKNAQFKNTKFVSFFCVFGVFLLFALVFASLVFMPAIMISTLIWNVYSSGVFFFLASQIRWRPRNVQAHVLVIWKALFDIIEKGTSKLIEMVACAPPQLTHQRQGDHCRAYERNEEWEFAERNKKMRICGRPCLCFSIEAWNTEYNQSYCC